MQTHQRVRVVFFGDIEPNTLTTEINIEPSYTWKKGDYIKRPPRKYNDNGWVLRTKEVKTLDTEKLIRTVFDRIYKKKETIIKLYDSYSFCILVSVLLYIENNVTPILSFSSELIGMIADINGEIDIDIVYC